MAIRKPGRDALARREIHATDDEWSEIKATARAYGLTISRYLVERPGAHSVAPPPKFPDLGLAIARLHAEVEHLAAVAAMTSAAGLILPHIAALEARIVALSAEASR